MKRYHILLKGSNIPIKGIIEYDVKNADMGNQSKNKLFNNNCLNNKLQIKKDTIPRKKFDENKYNFMTYEEAILYDYRTCFEYYKYLLKTKHPILFGFCPLKDYNSMIIKSDILYLSFSIYYAINFSLFTEDIIHNLFENGGKYNILDYYPTICISFAISHIIIIILLNLYFYQKEISWNSKCNQHIWQHATQ